LIDDLIKKIDPLGTKFWRFVRAATCRPRIELILVLSVDKKDAVPDVGFGARTIRFLAHIGAFINVDYGLSARV
jgi:hypothetical protein